jgi:TrmH family RNA methyltransferase
MEINSRLHNRLGARENDYAIGVFQVTETRLDPEKNHVVLVHPGGRGNLGTIIRTMLGFNFQDLAIIKPAADILHPDVIRASMGALFQLRFELFTDFRTYEDKYPRNMYPLMTNGEIALPDAVFKLPYSLIFGNESSGLSEDFYQIGTSVSIPQSRRIDSLNLAASVSVTLYQANLQNER